MKSAVIDLTGTKVKLTLSKALYSSPLSVADYIVCLGKTDQPSVNISDVAGNGVYNGTQFSFRPTVDQLQNTDALANQNLTFIKFLKPVDTFTAQTTSNYVIKNINGVQIAVTRAVAQPVAGDGTETVYLTTADQVPGTQYTVTTSNIKDTIGNIIADDNTAFTGSSTDNLLSNSLFTDKNLEQAIINTIEATGDTTGDISKSNIDKIRELTITAGNITDLSGIENLTNLNTLNLNEGLVNDFEPLSKLTNLNTLKVIGNGYSSGLGIDSLKVLTNLTTLSLTNGCMYSLESLIEMKNLTTLDLSNDYVSDVTSLTGLTKLTTLDLSNNQIINIEALKGLTNLTTLDLSNNTISKSDIVLLKNALPNCIINSGNITGVSLNKYNDNIIVGGTDTLIATVSPSDIINKMVIWTSSNPSVATVDNTGKVAAINVGTVTISARAGNQVVSCKVSSVAPIVPIPVPVTTVSLNKTTDSLKIGETDNMIATVNPTNATNKIITWTSSDNRIATVDNTGKVSAISAGIATMTVTTVDGKKTGTCTITVNNSNVKVKSVGAIDYTKNIGDEYTLPTTVMTDLDNDSSKELSVTWNRVADTSVVGKFTFIGTLTMVDGVIDPDKVTVTATLNVVDTDITSKFTDPNFKNMIYAKIGKDSSDHIFYSEVKDITDLDVSGKHIASLNGIEYFKALTNLNCSKNQLATLDVSNNTALKSLDCSYNQFTSLNMSKNTILESLDCSFNQLSALTISNSNKITDLNCSFNQIATLNMSNDIALKNLNCFKNNINSLDVTNCITLVTLNCYENHELSNLDVSGATALTTLNRYGDGLSILDISHNTNLTTLNCYYNEIRYLDVSHNGVLTTLNCYGNSLSNLDVSHNTSLITLNCYNNYLSTLEVSNNANLITLNCYNNYGLSNLDVSGVIALTTLNCYNNSLSALNLSHNNALTALNCENNKISGLDLSKNISLTDLNCSSNQLTYLDVSDDVLLSDLICTNNRLPILDVTYNTALANLNCSNNYLTTLDINKNTLLNYNFNCAFNQITTLYALNKNQNFYYYQTQYTDVTHTTTINNLVITDLSVYPVSSITVTGAAGVNTIANGATLQMSAMVTPENATDKAVTWSVVSGPGTIDENGLLTATGVGTVTVKAAAKDGSLVDGIENITVDIGNQVEPKGLMGVAPIEESTSGVITGTTEAMEYKLSSADDSAYVSCSETQTTLAPGDYVVRLSARKGFNAGMTSNSNCTSCTSRCINFR